MTKPLFEVPGTGIWLAIECTDCGGIGTSEWPDLPCPACNGQGGHLTEHGSHLLGFLKKFGAN